MVTYNFDLQLEVRIFLFLVMGLFLAFVLAFASSEEDMDKMRMESCKKVSECESASWLLRHKNRIPGIPPEDIQYLVGYKGGIFQSNIMS